MSQLQEQERRVGPQKGQCPERLGRNPLFPPQVLIFSLHVVNNQPYMCKREVGLGFDMASVGVMDVQKSNPSQGGSGGTVKAKCKQFCPGKELFFYLCQSITVSTLNWKSMQRKKKPKWSSELKYSLHRVYLNCAKISVWRKRERKEKRNGIHFSFPRGSWKHLLSGLQSETVYTSVKKQSLKSFPLEAVDKTNKGRMTLPLVCRGLPEQTEK